MKTFIHKILFRVLSRENYLQAVSSLFFLSHRLGLGRRTAAMEYVYHLPSWVSAGDVCIDIGANLGYYARPLSRLAGPEGRVYAVEPVPPVLGVLRRNLRRCRNVEILPYALGGEDRMVRMANDSVARTGYLGTGQNYVNEGAPSDDVEYPVRMCRGSELFASLGRLDFVKCDVEGYELHVMRELRPLLERFRPRVLIETGGENRPRIIELFASMGYSGRILDKGREIPLPPLCEGPLAEKDIIFYPEK